MNKQMESFSFSPPVKLFEEENWLLAVTSFKATNSVFIIASENNSFSISIPGRWRIPNFLPEGIIDKLNDLLELRSENGIELHVEEVKKRGIQIRIGDKKSKLFDLDAHKNDILEELKSANHHDLKDLVYGMQLK